MVPPHFSWRLRSSYRRPSVPQQDATINVSIRRIRSWLRRVCHPQSRSPVRKTGEQFRRTRLSGPARNYCYGQSSGERVVRLSHGKRNRTVCTRAQLFHEDRVKNRPQSMITLWRGRLSIGGGWGRDNGRGSTK